VPSVPADAAADATRAPASDPAAQGPRPPGVRPSPSTEGAGPLASGPTGTARSAGEAGDVGSVGSARGSRDQEANLIADAGSGGSAAAPGAGSIARLTPGEGRGGSDGRAGPDGAIPPEYEGYVRALRQRVQDRLAYPWTAVRRGQQGVVEVELRLGPDGRLVTVAVVAGASADALRGAAVAAVRKAAPFPFPPGLQPRPLVIRLPVEFRLR
jgi:protein TonB